MKVESGTYVKMEEDPRFQGLVLQTTDTEKEPVVLLTPSGDIEVYTDGEAFTRVTNPDKYACDGINKYLNNALFTAGHWIWCYACDYKDTLKQLEKVTKLLEEIDDSFSDLGL